MTNPITPPPELVKQWVTEVWHEGTPARLSLSDMHIATEAALWAADQELNECCKWLHWQNLATHADLIPSLRAARRPKPPNLKAQALAALSRADKDALTNPLTGEVGALRTILSKEQSNTIRRALEQLDD